ncbi:peroxisomal leader peptide-processing protease-like [Acanthaster planci]|uniref:Peroxisomal leader peptide-processing protease n=1 Tax=Acanthaster planci TaxID=133434 RepID=A0A8B7YU97_ACAPL|nr:peroxisomal leader peptide-processing protease-like [Acanthaster planci]XP_022094912.1 peroxisomal leader peptide-processing protease-like [Acanthaster planci]
MDGSRILLADSCVVHVQKQQRFHTRGENDQSEYSCSGIVIDPLNGLVLTSGQVFSEVVHYQRSQGLHVIKPGKKGLIPALQKRESHGYSTATEVMKNVHIDVILPVPQQVLSHLAVLPASSATSATKHSPTYTSSHKQSGVSTMTRKAQLISLWKCQEFHNLLQAIIPETDGWKYTEYGEGQREQSGQAGDSTVRSGSGRDSPNGQCVEPFGLSSVSRNLPRENFISWFALLKLQDSKDNPCPLGHPSNAIWSRTLQDAFCLQQGDPVCLHTTPFGSTCPAVFLNSISKGIVSNVAGPKHQLIMTDARCIPGSEGGGMYLTKPGRNHQESVLAGIIVAPLCWKNNEWIGLTLVCSIQAVLDSLRCITDSLTHKKVTSAPPSWQGECKPNQGRPLFVVQQCMKSVVLIKASTVWGSGVLINADKGVILTCRHVVHKATDHHVRVRIDCPYLHWEDATVVYTTSPNSPFDLAVLKLEEKLDALREAYRITGLRMATSYTQGQPVIMVGHALLAPELDLSPSVSLGVMSKVNTANSTPVMLQSTCAVHAGASGGALFCHRTGQLLGIVTSNARDMDSGASFPHVNFSIPWTVIGPALNKYLQTDDVTKLDSLEATDDHSHLVALWSLDNQRLTDKKETDLTLSKL